jgi:serine protease Do
MFKLGVILTAAALALPAVAKEESEGSKDCCPQRVQMRFRTLGDAGGGHLGVGLSDDKDGPRVTSVDKGSPADKAGFKKDDVIVRYAGEAAASARKMVRLVQETPAGRTVKVEVQRDGKPMTLEPTLDDARGARLRLDDAHRELAEHLPDMDELRGLGKDMHHLFLAPQPRRLGIRYQEISGQLARYFHVEHGQALLVAEVDEDSPAAKAGVKAGDVLLSVGGRDVEDAEDLHRVVSEATGEIKLKVLRDGKALELTATLPRRSGAKETT